MSKKVLDRFDLENEQFERGSIVFMDGVGLKLGEIIRICKKSGQKIFSYRINGQAISHERIVQLGGQKVFVVQVCCYDEDDLGHYDYYLVFDFQGKQILSKDDSIRAWLPVILETGEAGILVSSFKEKNWALLSEKVKKIHPVFSKLITVTAGEITQSGYIYPENSNYYYYLYQQEPFSSLGARPIHFQSKI